MFVVVFCYVVNYFAITDYVPAILCQIAGFGRAILCFVKVKFCNKQNCREGQTVR